jgi:large subunit ribosomal protein L4
VKAYLANQRQGTAKTKIRKHVTGGNQKPWKQKGTGRARQGSTRAPHWVGGGTVFGPIPRSYRQDMPKQAKALARKSAFNARARENSIIIIDQFGFDAPKTSRIVGLVDKLGVADQKVLILTSGNKPNVFLSARNIPNVHVMPYAEASTYHILWSDVVLIESEALGESLDPIAEPERSAAKAERKSDKPTAPAREAKSATTGAKRKAQSPKATAKKTTAKRASAKKAETKTKKAASPKAKAASNKKASGAKRPKKGGK